MPTLLLPRNPLRAAILATLSFAPVAYAAPVAPGGAIDASEFLVNTTTKGVQFGSQVARDAAGDFVVVWGSFGQASGTSKYDVYAQRYDAAGDRQGSEFLVNTFTSGEQMNASVAMDAAGDFVVVWQSVNQASSASSYDIYARQYNAAGTALQNSEFLVNTVTSGIQRSPRVAMDAAGDFVVAWESYAQAGTGSGSDVYARQYNRGGTALQPSEFLVNTFTDNQQQDPSVAMDAAGDFVVAWDSSFQASSNNTYDVYARQFKADGSALQASEFLVNTVTDDNQLGQVVAMDAEGDFVVAWEGADRAAYLTTNYNIFARQYDKAGTALQASQFRVSTDTNTGQGQPKVAMDATGDFVVAWEDYTTPGTSHPDVFARVFDAAGTALQATQSMVNTVTADAQAGAAVAMDAAGDYVVMWSSYGQAASSSDYDVYARRYQGPETVDLGTTLASSPGSVSTGGAFSLTLGVSNKATASTISNDTIAANLGNASGLAANFTLPAGVTFNQATGSNWSCGSVSGTSLSCSFTGSLAAATAAPALTLDFTAPTGTGSLAFTAQVTASAQQAGSDSTANSASTTITAGGGGSTGGGSGGGAPAGGSSGGGAFGLLSLAFLGLPLLRRRRAKA